jgi:acetylornithine/succinyldiaminopimelate/putrescine aminotransferase
MDSKSIIEQEDRYVLPTYAKFPFLLTRGQGNEVFDSDGRRYLDLYGGHAVCIIGHSHPRLVEALNRQIGELMFYSNVCYHPARAAAARHMVEKSYPGMAQVYFCNSGAEANETALKMARRFTGRSRVISMIDGFHGRTIGALSVTGRQKLRDSFSDNLDDMTDFVGFGDLDAIASQDLDQVAAILLEPVQSMAGIRLAPAEYYQGLRDLCTRHGVVLIFDEVQTAPGRTGSWFVGSHWQVEPDLVTAAKGIGGGFPAGAVIANRAISDTVQSGDQGSTFGGGPLAAVAIETTFQILEDEGLPGRAAALSVEVIERFEPFIKSGLVKEVRGKGYLLGVECTRPAKEISRPLREMGILVGSSYDENTFRLLPPLTVGQPEWDEFFAAFGKVEPI